MIYLVFLGGIVLGTIITRIFIDFRTAHGYFKLEPYDDDDTGFYKINIRIPGETDLLHNDRIILTKDHSQD